MQLKSRRNSRRELTTAALVGALWALLGLALASAFGAEVETFTQPVPTEVALMANTTSASCRIFNYLPDGSTNIGSGTLVDVADGRSRGLILTCAHLFTEGLGRVVVQFPDGHSHGALVISQDAQADLAALEISNPQAEAASVAIDVESNANLTACGFGPSGEYRCIAGRAIGYSEGPGQQSLRMSGAVRSGDSGGGVFDGQGRLVAVVWGETSGVTYASTGQPLRQFLSRLLPQRGRVIAAKPIVSSSGCANGRCPLVGGGINSAAPAGRGPAASGALPIAAVPRAPGAANGTCSCGCGDRLKAIAADVLALQQGKQDRGDYALRADLSSLAKSSDVTALADEGRQRHESLLNRLDQLPATLGGAGRAAGVLATTALGISGPAGWAIIAGASVGGWLVGRRLKRRRKRKDRQALRGVEAKEAEATAAAEASFPVERDDREARELLRLSQLEGRDPLQDALAGRIALDRLDALAEGDGDSSHAAWADQLSRELRDRFNEIAPTKLTVK
jgi:S1-C subfamily serine protease